MQNTHFSMIPKNITEIRMTSSARAVYAYMTLFRKQDTGECWTSQTKLARDLGYCRITIVRAIKKLIELKLIAFANKWKHGRYKFYKIFKSVQGGLNRHARRFASRVTKMKHHMFHKCNNLSEYDYNIKEKIKRKSKNGKKVISKSQLNEITKKATESIAKNFRFMGNFDKIKNNEFVKTSIADKIRILSEAL